MSNDSVISDNNFIYNSQEKSIEYVHSIIEVNEMVNTTITIVNIPFILYHI